MGGQKVNTATMLDWVLWFGTGAVGVLSLCMGKHYHSPVLKAIGYCALGWIGLTLLYALFIAVFFIALVMHA